MVECSTLQYRKAVNKVSGMHDRTGYLSCLICTILLSAGCHGNNYSNSVISETLTSASIVCVN